MTIAIAFCLCAGAVCDCVHVTHKTSHSFFYTGTNRSCYNTEMACRCGWLLFNTTDILLVHAGTTVERLLFVKWALLGISVGCALRRSKRVRASRRRLFKAFHPLNQTYLKLV